MGGEGEEGGREGRKMERGVGGEGETDGQKMDRLKQGDRKKQAHRQKCKQTNTSYVPIFRFLYNWLISA